MVPKRLSHAMDMCSKVVLVLVVEAAVLVFYAGLIWDLNHSRLVRKIPSNSQSGILPLTIEGSWLL